MLKLDIGCGGRGSMYPDFLGIDIHPIPENPRTNAAYIQLDFINDDLPFESGSVDEIVALHIVEHLMPDDAATLIFRSFLLLKPGCSAYIAVPDLHLFALKYLQQDKEFWDTLSAHYRGPTYADKFNYYMHQNTHKWQYDIYSLTWLVQHTLTGEDYTVEVLPKDHKWCKRPNHEIGVIITKND